MVNCGVYLIWGHLGVTITPDVIDSPVIVFVRPLVSCYQGLLWHHMWWLCGLRSFRGHNHIWFHRPSGNCVCAAVSLMLSRPLVTPYVAVKFEVTLGSQSHLRYYTYCNLYLLKHFFYIFDFGIDFLTLKMTMNHSNNIIDGFSGQNRIKKRYLYLLKIIFKKMTLKWTFWPWRWPWIVKIISKLDCPIKVTRNELLHFFLAPLLQNHIWPWNWP